MRENRTAHVFCLPAQGLLCFLGKAVFYLSLIEKKMPCCVAREILGLFCGTRVSVADTCFVLERIAPGRII